MTKMWLKRAGEVAKNYEKNKKELAQRREGKNSPRLFGEHKKERGISKPVEQAVVSIASDRRVIELEREVEAVDWAFAQLKKIKDSDDITALAKKLYTEGRILSTEGAALELNLSRATAFRHNAAFLKLVAAYLGIWDI